MTTTTSPRHRSRPRRCNVAVLAIALGALAPLALRPAFAQEQESAEQGSDRLAAAAFPVNDADPESSVPTVEQAMRRPLQMGYFVMLLVERGTAATERGDHYGALKYYRALAKAVPERSQAFKMLCKEYEVIGDFERALENCKLTLGKSGVTVEDNVRFVDLTLKKRGALPQSDIEDVEAVIAHLETQLGNSEDAPIITNQLRCDLATRLEDVARLEECTKQLRTLAPKDPKTIAYSWALALQKRDYSTAKRIIAQAKRIGLPAAAIEKMERGLANEQERGESASGWFRTWGFAGGAVVLLAAALSAFLLRRKRTMIAGHLGPG